MMLGALVPTRARLSVMIAPWDGKEEYIGYAAMSYSDNLEFTTSRVENSLPPLLPSLFF